MLRHFSSNTLRTAVAFFVLVFVTTVGIFISAPAAQAQTSSCKAETYNECCGPGTSRKVTRNCPSGSYTVGACNQSDGACGQKPATPVSCPPGQFWYEPTKNCRAADSNQNLPNGATPKPGVDPGTGGTPKPTVKPGGTPIPGGNIANPACNPNQVCGYCGGANIGNLDTATGVISSNGQGPYAGNTSTTGNQSTIVDDANTTLCVNTPGQSYAQYILACDCNSDGKTDRQIVTNTIKGSQAAGYCASTLCPAVGSNLPGGTKKVCEPGYPYQCTGDGKGIMCNDQGTGPTAGNTIVNAHACRTTEYPDNGQSTRPADCGPLHFIGCSGLKNCWACSDNKRYFCVYEPGLSCGAKTPPSTPLPGAPTPPPPTTPPVITQGPVCLSLAVSKQIPRKGDTVFFTCGKVNGAARYEFRVKLPDGTFQNLASSTVNANDSQPFTVQSSGAHYAQCRICTGAAASTCQAFENI